MDEVAQTIDGMFAAWNQTEAPAVRAHLDRVLSPEVHFVDPSIDLVGIEASSWMNCRVTSKPHEGHERRRCGSARRCEAVNPSASNRPSTTTPAPEAWLPQNSRPRFSSLTSAPYPTIRQPGTAG